MPHKVTSKVEGAVDQVSTLRKLGKALGVIDDTLTQWRRRGMPAGPPYSITATYVWARSQGLKPKLPADGRLAALCKAGVPDADEPVGDLPGHSAYDRLLVRAKPRTYADALQREKVIGEEIANKTRLADLEKTLGKLFTEEQVMKREADFDQMLMIEIGRVTEFAMSLVATPARDDALEKAKAFLAELRVKISNLHKTPAAP